MNGRAFKLGTFARPSGEPFAAIVLGDEVVDLTRAYEIYRASAQRNALTSTNGILDLLQNWDANFLVLQEIVAFLDKEGLKPGAANLSAARALPPASHPARESCPAARTRCSSAAGGAALPSAARPGSAPRTPPGGCAPCSSRSCWARSAASPRTP